MMEFKAIENIIFLTKLSKDLKKLDKVLWQSGLTSGELDEVRECINNLQEKVEKCINLLDNYLDGTYERGFIDEKELEKYVDELKKYIRYSNDILTVVKTHVRPALFTRLIKAKDSIPTKILKVLGLHPGEFVLKYEDAEKLLDMAILKTVDVMRRESND